ncbi:hypothetical protein B0T17DRAFT_224624 [Bombardia bombarda]|uniref:Uncharacterized protein n=1 Tax=Bombardia bombarda TaxID=252184 RepID=A0AA39XAY6_9PEZI|nr:hypothetical protein B0T17DRAFT_224624 [Bombardia bombarda]
MVLKMHSHDNTSVNRGLAIQSMQNIRLPNIRSQSPSLTPNPSLKETFKYNASAAGVRLPPMVTKDNEWAVLSPPATPIASPIGPFGQVCIKSRQLSIHEGQHYEPWTRFSSFSSGRSPSPYADSSSGRSSSSSFSGSEITMDSVMTTPDGSPPPRDGRSLSVDYNNKTLPSIYEVLGQQQPQQQPPRPAEIAHFVYQSPFQPFLWTELSPPRSPLNSSSIHLPLPLIGEGPRNTSRSDQVMLNQGRGYNINSTETAAAVENNPRLHSGSSWSPSLSSRSRMPTYQQPVPANQGFRYEPYLKIDHRRHRSNQESSHDFDIDIEEIDVEVCGDDEEDDDGDCGEARKNVDSKPKKKKRSSNQKYTEEQNFFMIYHKADRSMQWAEITELFNSYFHDGRTRGGLECAYYRTNWEIPATTNEGLMIFEMPPSYAITPPAPGQTRNDTMFKGGQKSPSSRRSRKEAASQSNSKNRNDPAVVKKKKGGISAMSKVAYRGFHYVTEPVYCRDCAIPLAQRFPEEMMKYKWVLPEHKTKEVQEHAAARKFQREQRCVFSVSQST